MDSIVKVFSNFKDFYNEINAATLTGAIDVIVVEQDNGDFLCSPFHVRFGKLGVLRSREKVVDIEINGEPVDIHMKLGESGEAFFVEECGDDDVDELPENLATSPIPTNYFQAKYGVDALEDGESSAANKLASDEIKLALPLPLPRRNSIDFSKEMKDETLTGFENQVSDYSHRRHTDNVLDRRNLDNKVKEYTTQKLRQKWAEHEEIFQLGIVEKDKDWSNSTQTDSKAEVIAQAVNETAIVARTPTPQQATASLPIDIVAPSQSAAARIDVETISKNPSIKEESKGKKKRRKKSQLKKKNAARKSSSSSSIGSNAPADEASALGGNGSAAAGSSGGIDESDAISNSISVNSPSSVDDTNNSGPSLVTAHAGDDSPMSDICEAAAVTSPLTPSTRIPELDIHFFSDTEVTSSGGNGNSGSTRNNARNAAAARNAAGGRPATPVQSDSELELSMRDKDGDMEVTTASWNWGQLPTTTTSKPIEAKDSSAAQTAQSQRNSMLSGMFNFMKKSRKQQVNDISAGGIYLSDLESKDIDPEMAAVYFPQVALTPKETSATSAATMTQTEEEDRESGNGTSLPQSPSSMEGRKSIDSDYDDGKQIDPKFLEYPAMSLCGVGEGGAPPTDEEFEQHLIKYSDVCRDPDLFASPNLIVRLNGKYYTWAAACPIVMTIITFNKPLSDDAIGQLIGNIKPEIGGGSGNGEAGRETGTGDGAGPTLMATASDLAGAADGEKNPGNDNNASTDTNNTSAGQTKRSWWYWRRSQDANNATTGGANAKTAKLEKSGEAKDLDQTMVATTQTTRPNSPDVSDAATLSKTDSTLNAENTSALIEDLSHSSSKTTSSNNKSERYRKTLRLSSEAIKKLNLNEGMNEIEFSVTTAYQGTTRCKCYLYRWKHNDKVVISDIDGTITKSDVLGHILPMVGKDWAQLGVAELFSKIERNGYKLLYLSARAIGQARVTREYLRSIRQGDVTLPDGPLLLNPTSLISAFHREVIERKPELFKIACLADIRELFPDKNPFYAGYGNRINDVWAYRAVGIPIMRIFTINTKGELKHELTQTFQSSYCSMAYIADQLFPPVRADEASIEFSNFHYWRDPIPEIEFEDIEQPTPAPPSSSATQSPPPQSSSSTKNGDNTANQSIPKK